MNRISVLWVVVIGFGFGLGLATVSADTGSGSAGSAAGSAGSAAGSAAGTAAGSAAAGTAAGSAAAGSAAGSAAPTMGIMPQVPEAPVSPADVAALRKTCVAAMNADPTFAAAISATADKQAAEKRDAETIQRHKDTAAAIAQNERHVILSYAAMWIIAALFVIFLWRRQQGLKVELANLKDDLERAAKKANE